MVLQFLKLIQGVFDLDVTINSVDIKLFRVVIILLMIGKRKKLQELQNTVMCLFY